MKSIYLFLTILFITTIPALAEDPLDTNSIIVKMKTQLDLQEDQVTNITPIIQKYAVEFQDLEKSIGDGTINPSAIDSQRQGMEDQETQELSAYLKPNQLSEWRDMQAQMDKQQVNVHSDGNTDDTDADRYTNLPGN